MSDRARRKLFTRLLGGFAALALFGALPAGCEYDSGEVEQDDQGNAESAAATGQETPAATSEAAATNSAPQQTIYAQMEGIDNSAFMGEQYNGAGCETLPLTDGQGGWVSNPSNIRGTLKFVFPVSYRDRIERVTVYTPEGVFFDEFYRDFPDENDGRPRYYGTMPIEVYPAGLFLKVLMKDGSCRTLQHPNPQQRYT